MIMPLSCTNGHVMIEFEATRQRTCQRNDLDGKAGLADDLDTALCSWSWSWSPCLSRGRGGRSTDL